IYKPAGGQASAFNAGFVASAGEIVLFLDADDWLLREAVERAVERLRETGAVKVHWPLMVVDEQGQWLDHLLPAAALPEGDLMAALVEEGPWMASNPPTSG